MPKRPVSSASGPVVPWSLARVFFAHPGSTWCDTSDLRGWSDTGGKSAGPSEAFDNDFLYSFEKSNWWTLECKICWLHLPFWWLKPSSWLDPSFLNSYFWIFLMYKHQSTPPFLWLKALSRNSEEPAPSLPPNVTTSAARGRLFCIASRVKIWWSWCRSWIKTEARNLSECFGKARLVHCWLRSSIFCDFCGDLYKNHVVYWDIWDSHGDLVGWTGQIRLEDCQNGFLATNLLGGLEGAPHHGVKV